MENKKFWDNIYKNKIVKKPSYDLWLDRYADILKKYRNEEIIDLGCGIGADTLYLSEKRHKVVSCDYSEEALKKLKEAIPEAKTIQMDISKTLPFDDGSTGLIIADLSLHYFDDKTTQNIIKEIRRVLKPKGCLIGRVNSINDFNFGAGCGEEIERNFYLTEAGYKRFFTKEDIHFYFSDFVIEVCEDTCVSKYGNEKKAIEFMVRKG
ncbi:class I SAM-dependent methyltransferase [Clostridium saccharoperbutylacetonicum]|uniref:class I SAM-dependent methyltransferase n=1 Tax=Clostridium saccharoperbutylacetonicum TaxID=36745 RepID=UPI000983B580|nr:class I SAM-dependent methyltransferase [Clostridium saccharoperbutylacetonicum]AQR96507.1 demethylmenaquinone methyltransferase [Clostridium saccharoperbutylacetonicum]NSB32382.1 SAM-dependent methyltransferase [Clostridium saccharoperbutylacetonicum]